MNGESTGALPQVKAAQAVKTLLALFWREDKGYYAVLLAQGVAGALNNLVNLTLPKLLIDGLSQGWAWPRFLRGVLAFVAAKYLVLQALSWLTRKDKLHKERLQTKVPMAFAYKVMRLKYPKLEDPEVLDLKERALFPITNYGALMNLMAACVSTLTGLMTLGGLTALLFAFSPWFLLALLALCAAASLLSGRFAKALRAFQQQIIPVNRRYGYWVDAIVQPEHQKEFRVLGLHQLMQSKVLGYTEEITTWLHGMYVRQGNNATMHTLIMALTRALAHGYAALRVLGAQWGPPINLGDFSVVVMASESFFTTFQGLFQGLFSAMTAVNHLLPFAQFMGLEEASQPGGAMPQPLQTLAFEGVTFRYPAGDRVILNDLSFEIKAGEKVSVVGLNNAGKSTMVKLICRLFEPTQGRILWNGRDIRDYDYNAYLQQLSCVFQDFFLFPFTVRDNLDPEGTGSEEAIRAVLKQTDMLDPVEKRAGGIHAHLNKAVWDDATEFSGGQRQKLAIARSLFRPAQLVILDEPTAALDPLAESQVYQQFHQLTQGRTALFISHRMSSSTFCDRILLLEDGRVAAFDSHRNLMREHNLYRQLFEAQAQHFQGELAASVDAGMGP